MPSPERSSTIRSYFLILSVIFAGITAGCSGGSESVNSNSRTNSANANNIQSNFPASTAPVPNANSSTNSPGSNTVMNIPTNNAAVKKIPTPGKSMQTSGPTQPAPDNSEVSSVLTNNLVQTRTFKNNPQLLKVEITTIIAENNRKVVKVYLKNGKVKELPEGKVGDPLTETADNILKAVE